MKIRKLYRFESAHIVRGAISQRCSHSYHGHGGVVEVFFTANDLDKAGMIYDFGAMKDTVGSFIDMFDHSVHLWRDDEAKSLNFFMTSNDRWIVLPCNPTAENYCVLLRDCINDILRESNFTNGENGVTCCGVRYHETATGYAESDNTDPVKWHLYDLIFSPQTLVEASEAMRQINCRYHLEQLEKIEGFEIPEVLYDSEH